MHLPEVFNAPRLCELGGRPYWVRALSLADWATVIGWLDDVLPGRADREEPPALSDEASQRALESGPGRMLLTWLALRHEDVTYSLAREIWDGSSPAEQFIFLDILMHRRRTLSPSTGSGTDLGQTWCAKGMAELAREIGPEAFARLSLDQLEWLGSGGICDGEVAPSWRAADEAIAGAKRVMDAFGLGGDS